MQIDKAPSYERDRKKSQNKINPADIEAAEQELLNYPNIKASYNLKPIKCKKEKTKLKSFANAEIINMSETLLVNLAKLQEAISQKMA